MIQDVKVKLYRSGPCEKRFAPEKLRRIQKPFALRRSEVSERAVASGRRIYGPLRIQATRLDLRESPLLEEMEIDMIKSNAKEIKTRFLKPSYNTAVTMM